jgi:hypothetical protein
MELQFHLEGERKLGLLRSITRRDIILPVTLPFGCKRLYFNHFLKDCWYECEVRSFSGGRVFHA